MKIGNIWGQQPVQENPEIGSQSRPEQDGSFAALLEAEMGGGVREAGADRIAISEMQGLSALAPLTGATDLSGGISAIEEALSGLDSLQDALLSNGSAREVDAIAYRLDAGVLDLQDRLESLPEDHPLRRLGEEINVAAYMESVKWKRGDYL